MFEGKGWGKIGRICPLRAACLRSPRGWQVESNYVQFCDCKTLLGQFYPLVTLMYFQGICLFLDKNTDGTLELMCSGPNGPWTFWADLLWACTSLKEKNAPLSRPLSLSESRGFNLYTCHNFSSVELPISSMPARHRVLIAKLICCCLSPLHRGGIQMDIWTEAVGPWKSLQLAHFLIEAISSLSPWHFMATFSAGQN